MMRSKPTQQGFTVLEMIIYIAVLFIIVTVVIAMFLWMIRSNARVKAVRNVSNTTRVAIDSITREVREATSIYTPTATSTQLSLETSKNPPADETSTFVDFFLCDTRLCIKREEQNPVAITSDAVEIVDINFQTITTSTTPSVQVTLQVNFKNPANKPELNVSLVATSTASLRSY